MATLNFPSITPSAISFGIRYNTQINTSPLSGSIQTIEIPGARWVAEVSFDDMEPAEGRVMAAFLAQLRGVSGRFLLKDFSHTQPRGTNLAAGAVTIDVTTQTPLVTGTVTSGGANTLEDTTKTFVTSGVISIGDYVENVTKSEIKRIISFTNTVLTVDSNWAVNPAASDTYNIYKGPRGNTITTVGWNTSQTGLLLPGDYIELEGNELKVVTSSVDSDVSGNATITFDPPIRNEPGNGTSVLRSDCRALMVLNDDENVWSTSNAGLLSSISFGCAEGF